jgi:hypothetical protein
VSRETITLRVRVGPVRAATAARSLGLVGCHRVGGLGHVQGAATVLFWDGLRPPRTRTFAGRPDEEVLETSLELEMIDHLSHDR